MLSYLWLERKKGAREGPLSIALSDKADQTSFLSAVSGLQEVCIICCIYLHLLFTSTPDERLYPYSYHNQSPMSGPLQNTLRGFNTLSPPNCDEVCFVVDLPVSKPVLAIVS